MNSRHGFAAMVAVALVVVGSVGAFGANAMLTNNGQANTADQVIAHDGENLTLENDPGQTIRGTTRLEAGSEVQIRLQSTGEGTQFIKSDTVTVDADGQYEFTADLSGIEPKTPFTITLHHDETVLANETGMVVAGTVPAQSESDANSSVLDYQGDELTLQNDPDQIIRGTTDLEAGSEIAVRLQSTGEGTQFIKTRMATVTEDGTFEVTVDMSGIEPKTPFKITVHHDETVIANVPGTVVAGTVPEQSESGTNSSVLDYEGDAITLQNDSGQTIRGTTELDAGATVQVRLRNNGQGTKFLKAATGTVGEDGRFEVQYNMTGINAGSTFTVVVKHDGEVIAEAPGKVTESGN